MTHQRQYAGDGFVVQWNQRLCIHAAECVRQLPQVFNPRRRPWVKVEEGSAEEVAAVVSCCPTGALTLETSRPNLQEEIRCPAEASLAANGPVNLRGSLRLLKADGEVLAEAPRIALCRCGASANKPYCDGSHREADFQAPSDLIASKIDSLAEEVTTLEVSFAPNGPVVLRGPLRILGDDGEVCFQGTRCALCRCGASSRKPFCDGSHSASGFQAP